MQNPTSYDVTVYCDGTYSYSCGFLWLDTCYEKREWSKLLSVKINFDLNQQDKNNLAILEGYRTEIADKVTNADKEAQKLNELVAKTPNPILPTNTKNDNSEIQKQINIVSNRFQGVVKALEEEDYGIGSTVSSSSDSSELSSTQNKISSLTSAVNANLERYNKIVGDLNKELEEVKTKASKLNFKFNSDLLKQLNEFGSSTYSKITNYQFSDLEEATTFVQDYFSL